MLKRVISYFLVSMLMITVVIWGGNAGAEHGPFKINIQGRLTEASGEHPAALSEVAFNVTGAGETYSYTARVSDGTLEYDGAATGIFNAVIDFTNLITTDREKFLRMLMSRDMSVEINAGASSITQELRSVPYAFFALMATKAGEAERAAVANDSEKLGGKTLAEIESTVPNPIIPSDGLQNIQGDLKVSGRIYGDGSELTGMGSGVPNPIVPDGGVQNINGGLSAVSPDGVGVRGETGGEAGDYSIAGVLGKSTARRGTGVVGEGGSAGSATGVYGTAPTGTGVLGLSTSGTGVYGISSSGTGVQGISSPGNSESKGVYGRYGSRSYGYLGSRTAGVWGRFVSNTGVERSYGILGTTLYGVYGRYADASGGYGASAYLGTANYGVDAYNPSGIGGRVRGNNSSSGANSGRGEHGALYVKNQSRTNGDAIVGVGAGGGEGVEGYSTSGYGVQGKSTTGIGVYGSTIAAGHDHPFKVKTFRLGNVRNEGESMVLNLPLNSSAYSVSVFYRTANSPTHWKPLPHNTRTGYEIRRHDPQGTRVFVNHPSDNSGSRWYEYSGMVMYLDE